jgi:hypothetical protein
VRLSSVGLATILDLSCVFVSAPINGERQPDRAYLDENFSASLRKRELAMVAGMDVVHDEFVAKDLPHRLLHHALVLGRGVVLERDDDGKVAWLDRVGNCLTDLDKVELRRRKQSIT